MGDKSHPGKISPIGGYYDWKCFWPIQNQSLEDDPWDGPQTATKLPTQKCVPCETLSQSTQAAKSRVQSKVGAGTPHPYLQEQDELGEPLDGFHHQPVERDPVGTGHLPLLRGGKKMGRRGKKKKEAFSPIMVTSSTLHPRLGPTDLEEVKEGGFGETSLLDKGHGSGEVVDVVAVDIQYHGLGELGRGQEESRNAVGLPQKGGVGKAWGCWCIFGVMLRMLVVPQVGAASLKSSKPSPLPLRGVRREVWQQSPDFSSYRGHEKVPDLLRRVPLGHAGGKGDLEHGVALQDLLQTKKHHLALPSAQHLRLHLHQRVPVILREMPVHQNPSIFVLPTAPSPPSQKRGGLPPAGCVSGSPRNSAHSARWSPGCAAVPPANDAGAQPRSPQNPK